MDRIGRFCWLALAKGSFPHEVITDEPDGGLVIVGHHHMEHREYEPLIDHPGLFLAFAELGTEQQEFAAFADTYGLLGLSGANFVEVEDIEIDAGSMRQERIYRTGEKLSAWLRAVAWMRDTIELWRSIQDANLEAIRRYASNENGILRIRDGLIAAKVASVWMRGIPKPVEGYLISGYEDSRLIRLQLQEIGATDPIGLGEWILAQEIDSKLHSCRLRMERSRGQTKLAMTPGSLWSAMVLQLAQAVDSKQTFRKCVMCGTWFPLSPGVNRADRKTCSDKCRTAFSRQRKKESKPDEQAAGEETTG